MDSYFANIYKTLNILCVEDNKDILEIYKNLFSILFKKVYFATDGLEGIESFKNNDIDIILTDHKMPNCNGLEMSKVIREMDSSVPIIMVTALESVEMLREAIDLHITSFLKKPFTSESLFSTFNFAVKSVIAERSIIEEQKEKLLYSNYQEKLTFDKEQIITKNDTKEDQRLFAFRCNVFYRPKDILSGDSYIIKKISSDDYLLFLVDGMGKGISASVTAMLCSAFVNYFIENSLKKKETFCLEKLLQALLAFIQPNLLEDEVISTSFLHYDNKEKKVHYALFSMPPPLYMLQEDPNVYKIKSNNTPLAPYTKAFKIDTLEISKLSKMLIYSDGLTENRLRESQNLYNSVIKDDFKNAQSFQDFQNLSTIKVSQQEDDITYVMLYKEQR